MCNFNVGDYVEINYPGLTYCGFKTMFKLIGFNKKEKNEYWRIGEKGVIFSIDIHLSENVTLLSIQHEDGRQCLIREDGVTFISSRKPFKLNR